MKNLVCIALVFIAIIATHAQNTKTIQLKPILKNGKKYYYGGQYMVGGAYGLQVPMMELADPDVNLYFKRFKNIRKLKGLVYLPSIVYLLYTPVSTQRQADNFTVLLVSGIAADILLNNVAHRQMRKGIDIYNIKILQRNATGFGLTYPPGRGSMQLGFSYRFR